MKKISKKLIFILTITILTLSCLNTESVEVNQAKHVKFFDFEKVHIMASSIIERDSLVSSWELVDSSQIYFKVGSEYLGYPNPIHFASYETLVCNYTLVDSGWIVTISDPKARAELSFKLPPLPREQRLVFNLEDPLNRFFKPGTTFYITLFNSSSSYKTSKRKAYWFGSER